LYNILVPSHSGCVIGHRCHFYVKSIGLTLDDILRDEIRPNTTLNNQSFSIKMSAALTIIILVGGLINSVFSFITFKNKHLRQVGCGMYLLASSITSLLTISLFTVKFWFVVLTQMSVSVSVSVLHGGCVSIEPVLKLFLYFDAWLNACVAVERAVNVSKGVHFDKTKSKRIARWMIIILPLCIMGTIIHEPLYRGLFAYETEIDRVDENRTEKNWTNVLKPGESWEDLIKSEENSTYINKTDEGMIQRHVWCVTAYSRSIQDYNTAILLFHLVGPFIANLFSALLIIFRAARQRSAARSGQNFKEHVREQLSEHKQLLISPVILLVLSLPRLIIALLPACVQTSSNSWLYLSAYLVSFIPSMLVFIIFVIPSELYRKTFKESISSWHRLTRQ
jgi:hypothetical protein